MAQHFKFIIIGAGMMGAAAARHLSAMSDGVALLGPDEPKDSASHTGVFASYYDEARITRTIDPDPEWALLANRSIARYGEIEAESGISFYHETGCLLVGSKTGAGASYVGNVLSAGARAGAKLDHLDNAAMAERFAYFSIPEGSEGVHEKSGAGYVNPRRLVEAQVTLAEKNGATLIRQTAASVTEEGGHVVVTTEEGGSFSADRVIVAAGGFTINRNLMPRPYALDVFARTVAFFELDADEIERFSGMPALIHKPATAGFEIYMLPPVRYPDGKTYLKIGGDPDYLVLPTEAYVRDWFRSGGRETARQHLDAIMRELVPGLTCKTSSMAACVTSFTPNGYPGIGFVPGSERVAVLSGGCGAAAKSSDELGRLGAVLLAEGRIDDPAYGIDFAPQFL